MTDDPHPLHAAVMRLAQQQIASEAESSGNDMQQRLKYRREFHRRLLDPAETPEALWRFHAESGGIDQAFLSSMYFGPSQIAHCRQVLQRLPCIFTPVEPPVTVWLIVSALGPLLANASPDLRGTTFIIGTDCAYRPHAQISRVSAGCHVIVLGRFLVDSLLPLARMLQDVLARARQDDHALPVDVAMGQGRLLPALQASLHRYQLPYFLASIYEGEKYRFGLRFDPAEDQPARHHRAFAFALLMLAFLLGHELAHVEHGDLEDTPGDDGPSPFEGFLDRDGPLWIEALALLDAGAVDRYRQQFLPAHGQELGANMDALVWTMNCAVDLTGKRWMGAPAAALVLALIGLFDRMQHLSATGRDPAMEIGLELYNAAPFVADVLLPQADHPWGKTRVGVLPTALVVGRITGSIRIDPGELRMVHGMMQGVTAWLSLASPEAMAIARWVARSPGEWVSWLDDHGLYTRYYPAGDDDRSHVAGAFYWPPDQLYGLADEVTLHGPAGGPFAMPGWPPPKGAGY